MLPVGTWPITVAVPVPVSTEATAVGVPDRISHFRAIEACHSVAGDENYILKVRVGSPAELEDLLRQIRNEANVSTRTTVVLSTAYENRPPAI